MTINSQLPFLPSKGSICIYRWMTSGACLRNKLPTLRPSLLRSVRPWRRVFCPWLCCCCCGEGPGTLIRIACQNQLVCPHSLLLLGQGCLWHREISSLLEKKFKGPRISGPPLCLPRNFSAFHFSSDKIPFFSAHPTFFLGFLPYLHSLFEKNFSCWLQLGLELWDTHCSP